MEEAVGKSIGTFERHWNVSVGKSASKAMQESLQN